MARSNTEIESKIPSFTAVRSEDFPKWLIVTCPRTEICGNKFMVREKEWLSAFYTQPAAADRKPKLIEGRVCPYCFRACRLPTRRSIK